MSLKHSSFTRAPFLLPLANNWFYYLITILVDWCLNEYSLVGNGAGALSGRGTKTRKTLFQPASPKPRIKKLSKSFAHSAKRFSENNFFAAQNKCELAVIGRKPVGRRIADAFRPASRALPKKMAQLESSKAFARVNAQLISPRASSIRLRGWISFCLSWSLW